MIFHPIGTPKRQKNYLRSYRDGWLSAKYGQHFSIIASTWPEWSIPGSAQGYTDGWDGRRAGLPLPEKGD